MANLNGYDATGGDTMETRDVLPAGEYVAVLTKSERRASKKNPQNEYLNLEFEVTEGDCAGRHFWTMLNLWNGNVQTVEIAQRELNSICHAAGRLRINDSEELHGIPMRVKLTVSDDSQYGPQNNVKGYKPLNEAGGAAHRPGTGGASQAGAPQAAWGRRTA